MPRRSRADKDTIKTCERAKYHRRDTEQGNPRKHPAPDVARDRRKGEHYRRERSTHTWRRAQQPRPVGPTCNTSRAYAGRSAVAPPNRTANKSSEIAPSTTGRERTNRRPSSTACQEIAAAALAARLPVASSSDVDPPHFRKTHENAGNGKQRRDDAIHGLGSGEIEKAAQCWTRDSRDLKARGAQGDRIAKSFRSARDRNNRLRRGHAERACDAE